MLVDQSSLLREQTVIKRMSNSVMNPGFVYWFTIDVGVWNITQIESNFASCVGALDSSYMASHSLGSDYI